MALQEIDSSLDEILKSRHIPDKDYQATDPHLKCCCGRPACAYLNHNNVTLEGLEKDVQTAAKLGQALLVRHEQYMTEAKRERQELIMKIEKLEAEKRSLAEENERKAEDNKTLVTQLDGLNGTVVEAEMHVKSLEATLHSAQQEMRRLEIFASRTEVLETQLAAVEQEQAQLQKTVLRTAEEERSAIQRWKAAERDLQSLHEQLEKIDREAREERERHAEVVSRMDRQRRVEKELDTAAGRLKGAAAAASISQGGKGTNQVVSHFVKDILQDNANLQLGIVELREMLLNSNDEVQFLREKLMLHQPVDEDLDDNTPMQSLGAELAPKEPPQSVSQEVHIHHHYHVPKKDPVVRPKKKRSVITQGVFTPTRGGGMQSPRIPRARPRQTSSSTAAAILAQTSSTVPPQMMPNNRWSMQSYQSSDYTASSVPSSPQSVYRYSSMFDRDYPDSSRPTSPGSSIGGPMSPVSTPYHHRKRGSEVSMRSFTAPTNFQPDSIIQEEDDDVEEIDPISERQHEDEHENYCNDGSIMEDIYSPTAFRPFHQRSTSHESILSISGLDIHTLKSHPSQLTITGSMILPRTRIGYGTPSTSVISTETITTASTATGLPTLSRRNHDSTSYLRTIVRPESRASNASNHSHHSNHSNESSGTLGQKVGGWVFGRWGVSPTPSEDGLRPKTPSQRTVSDGSGSASAKDGKEQDPLRAFMGRPPGVNQRGPIPGFKKPDPAPCQVTVAVVDTDALREVLEEV